ncbi:hypothetical protein Lebu_0826 [Leptotrichia buccalis C-1013-b]|uniref:Uncharacterized protein n=1 Tax=Leptotrichia buccalis (strain ATCC 14201 / DSM 1135 / JCM 12969 / NCTC 10249 / C-1013-b) TaxID=523794 RepID=C7N9A3_LEPBD|nr:hypothetical protein Lebu_0826 [Leptotrichia buccalis C-1013-b]
MIKTLYKEKCLRYFIVPDIILLLLVTIFFYPMLEFLYFFVIGNIPLIYILFKIIVMYLSSKKLKEINKVEDEEKRKKSKNKLKLVIFLVNLIMFSIYVSLVKNEIFIPNI